MLSTVLNRKAKFSVANTINVCNKHFTFSLQLIQACHETVTIIRLVILALLIESRLSYYNRYYCSIMPITPAIGYFLASEV